MRLFAALPLPAEARSTLVAWTRKCGPQPAVRWTPEEQLHITLHFLGEVANAQVDEVTASLGGVHARAFDVEFERIDVLGRAGVLVAAAKLTTPFSALEVEVRSRVLAFGEKPEANREFLPHVTVARARRGGSVPMPKALPRLPKIAFRAARFRLYRSDLRSEGAVHTVVQEWMMG